MWKLNMVTYRKISEINCDNLVDGLQLDKMDYDLLEDGMSELDARMKSTLDSHAPDIT